ncbi:MAG: 1-acyl-sn-glycerol-3-phosphate acyltransferase [Myxococcales bacterium]|nr:1-acyl-sn-glycerol-3-phosphate acyltransferase [Myxococcales bacterium]
MRKSRLAALPLKLTGWKFETDVPREKKYVCLAVPHTSNWDGALLLTLTRSIGLPISWMIKDDWIKGPMGALLRRMGAIAVNRKGSHDLVGQMIRELESQDELVLVIPPEGTRKRADCWRSGFYHIALGAKVPVVPGYLDYARKRAGLGPAIHLTGDVRVDMDAIRAFYTEKAPKGLVHEQFGPIRLKDEDRAPA